MPARLMQFKVGIVRWNQAQGWTHEYGVFRLLEDSMLADVPGGNAEDVTEMFGLREDQPEWDSVQDFESLRDAMDSNP